MSSRAGLSATVLALACLAAASGCGNGGGAGAGGSPSGNDIVVTVPAGASFHTVVDTLEARGLVRHSLLFRIYSRLRGVDRRVRAGSYAFAVDAPWHRIVDDLTAGRVLTVAVTIPEGFDLRQIAPRVADIAGVPTDSALKVLDDSALTRSVGVPGPGLEGYLFPDTYRFAPGTSVRTMVRTMVDRYHAFWTPVRRARLDSLGMTEKQVVTLASIVQAEARVTAEMDTIASVYRNRLRAGMKLEADPTVLYALGGHRDRLLYAAMDSVADSPYNTYTHSGLPPGPIASPGRDALVAALHPADTRYRYFVARADGTHVFSRTLAEHNRAVVRTRRDRLRVLREERARRARAADSSSGKE